MSSSQRWVEIVPARRTDRTQCPFPSFTLRSPPGSTAHLPIRHPLNPPPGRPSRPAATPLVAAPTGSGKTLTAFLAALDELVRRGLENGGLPDETAVLYVSPLKALSNDIALNLERPLAGIRAELERLGLPPVEIRTAVRDRRHAAARAPAGGEATAAHPRDDARIVLRAAGLRFGAARCCRPCAR